MAAPIRTDYQDPFHRTKNPIWSYLLVLLSSNILAWAFLSPQAFSFALAGAFFGSFLAISIVFWHAMRNFHAQSGLEARFLLGGVLAQWTALAASFVGLLTYLYPALEIPYWWFASKLVAVNLSLIAAHLQVMSTGRSHWPKYGFIAAGVAVGIGLSFVF